MIEAQRRASQNNLSLSEDNLEEYRRLFVRFIFRVIRSYGLEFLERHRPAFLLSRNAKLLRGSHEKKRLHHEHLPSLGTVRRNSSGRERACARITMCMKRRNPMCALLCVNIKDVR